jgi:hypothetical protein
LASETIVDSQQQLVEVTPDKRAERRSSADAAKRQRVTATEEDVIVLDPQRPARMCRPFEAAAGVARTESVDVGDVG